MKKFNILCWPVFLLFGFCAGGYFASVNRQPVRPDSAAVSGSTTVVLTSSSIPNPAVDRWVSLARTGMTISGLRTAAELVSQLSDQEVFSVTEAFRSAILSDAAIAAVLAERIAVMPSDMRIRVLRSLDHSGNITTLRAYAALFPPAACHDFSAFSTSGRGSSGLEHIRTAFMLYTPADPDRAEALMRKMKPPARSHALAGLISATAGSGKDQRILNLLIGASTRDKRALTLANIPEVAEIETSILLESFEQLPADIRQKAMNRWTTEHPQDALDWLIKHRSRDAQVGFIAGLHHLTNSESLVQVLRAIDQQDRHLPPGLKLRAVKALAVSAAGVAPDLCFDLLDRLPPGTLRDSAMIQASRALAHQPDALVLDIISGDEISEVGTAVEDRMINQQPRRLIGLLPYLPTDTADRVRAALHRTHGSALSLITPQ